ncbi:MAG: HD domain-containing protein [Campylobacterota bacterium]
MQEVKSYLNAIERSFAQTQGKDFLYKHTKSIDRFVIQAYNEVLTQEFGNYLPMKNSIPLVLVAMGSYGREQLCVYSDIDIMIVYDAVDGFNTQMLASKIVTKLFDTGLKIGHRVHEQGELLHVSKTDITIKTALLESRLIVGSSYLWTKVQNSLNAIRKDNPQLFIKQKLQEAKLRYKKYPITVEPDIKNSHGGFRDANLIYWIGNILFGVSKIKEIGFDEQEYAEFRKALEYLYRIRAALHISNGRKNDTLRFGDLGGVAKLLNDSDSYKDKFKIATKTLQSLDVIKRYTTIWSYRLCKSIFFEPSNIAKIKSVQRGVYRLDNRLLASKKIQRSLKTYLQILLDTPGFVITPSFIDKVKTSNNRGITQQTKAIFYQSNAYEIVNAMHTCAQLASVIKPMQKVMFMPQFDGYHQYSVHKHSLLTLKNIENLQEDFLCKLYYSLDEDERAMLKLVALLHDTGKGRVRDHSEVGARIFKEFGTKIGIKHIDLGVKLVKIHTYMSVVAQREDIYDDTIVLKFLANVEDAKTLDMLYLLTVADMQAVGHNIYNHFTKNLLRQLYFRAQELIVEKNALDEVGKRVKIEKRLVKSDAFLILNRSLQKKILQIESNLLFQKLNFLEICDLARIAEGVKDFYYEIENEDSLTIKIVRKKQLNIAYLLARLKRLNVVSMDIYKLFNGIKYFKIEFLHNVEEFEMQEIEQIIKQSFDMDKTVSLKKPIIYPKEVSIDCKHSKTVALMRLNCQNQSGLLAHVSQVFEKFGIDIISSKVNTHKNRARDLFLIQKSDKICNNIKKVIGSLCVE